MPEDTNLPPQSVPVNGDDQPADATSEEQA